MNGVNLFNIFKQKLNIMFRTGGSELAERKKGYTVDH